MFIAFLVIVVLLIFVLFVLFLVAVISLSFLFLMCDSSRLIDVSMLSSMLASLLPPTYCLSMLSLGCTALCMIISFWFCGPFVKVLPSSTLRMVSSVL